MCRPVSRCHGELCPDARRPSIRRANARWHGVLRPNSHCLCVSRWERYVPYQGASRASGAPDASGRSLCIRTQIFFPDGPQTYECYNCGKKDHISKECPQPKRVRVPWSRPYWAAEATYEEDTINKEAGKEPEPEGNNSSWE